jgi:hypothetical protein
LTSYTDPVTKAASSESRKFTTPATSSMVPGRFIAVLAAIRARISRGSP